MKYFFYSSTVKPRLNIENFSLTVRGFYRGWDTMYTKK